MTEIGKPTLSETMTTLTGWDEIAIEKASGYRIEQMTGDEDKGVPPRALLMTRCVAAVVVAREKQMPYADAYREVMGWPQSQVTGMFAPEPDDVIPDDPDSESGKGELQPNGEPTTWLSSASPPE